VICDSSRLPIIESTGPVSVTASGSRVVITFTQMSPKVHGVKPGLSSSEVEAVAIARIAFTKDTLDSLLRAISGLSLVRRPIAGHG
jgi:hypothetical protein